MPNRTPIPFIDLAAELVGQRSEIDAAIRRVIDSGRFLLGEELVSFEREFAAYNGSRFAVGVASGLAALKLMLQTCKIGPGDEVLVPANTYIATWLAVSAVGATPVPIEPDPATRNLDGTRLSAGLSSRTRAVLAVHLYGVPCHMDALRTFCDAHGLLLLIDAAQSCGAAWCGERRACLGDAAAFSFYPTKNLGALGDAGALVTDCPQRAEEARLLRNYGMQDRYDHRLKGENARLEELHAATLRVRLRFLEDANMRRRERADIYLSCLAEAPCLAMQSVAPQATPVWHLFTITLPDRDLVAAALHNRGIETAVHYPVPPHLSAAYASDRQWPSLPVTEAMAKQLLSLPIAPSLPVETIRDIAEAVIAALHHGGSSR